MWFWITRICFKINKFNSWKSGVGFLTIWYDFGYICKVRYHSNIGWIDDYNNDLSDKYRQYPKWHIQVLRMYPQNLLEHWKITCWNLRHQYIILGRNSSRDSRKWLVNFGDVIVFIGALSYACCYWKLLLYLAWVKFTIIWSVMAVVISLKHHWSEVNAWPKVNCLTFKGHGVEHDNNNNKLISQVIVIGWWQSPEVVKSTNCQIQSWCIFLAMT